ncbi:hypothetical protein K2D_19380 [Planctomycetes bacterium K2D]|nr:hypothetical protein K2D_19380 [Planctomycetes bacterium K2D]
MLKSRSFRLAVNLCVTGALLVPVGSGGRVLGNHCDALASSGIANGVVVNGTVPSKNAVCVGCGHCPVSHQGDFCGCCRKKPTPLARTADSHHGHSGHDGDSCSGHSIAYDHRPLVAVAQSSNESFRDELGVCLCGHEPEPAIPAPRNGTANDQLAQMLLLASASGIVTAEAPPLWQSTAPHPAPPSLLPRDSQRRLCVWRI